MKEKKHNILIFEVVTLTVDLQDYTATEHLQFFLVTLCSLPNIKKTGNST